MQTRDVQSRFHRSRGLEVAGHPFGQSWFVVLLMKEEMSVELRMPMMDRSEVNLPGPGRVSFSNGNP